MLRLKLIHVSKQHLVSNIQGAISGTMIHQVWWYTYAAQGLNELIHWGRVTYMCISNLTIIGSDNGVLSGWCQAITWTKAGILLIGPLVKL